MERKNGRNRFLDRRGQIPIYQYAIAIAVLVVIIIGLIFVIRRSTPTKENMRLEEF